jgi:WD40 repeat protein
MRTLDFVPNVRSIAFSRDGRQIFGSGGEVKVDYYLIHVWDVETGKFLRVLRGGHTGFLMDLSLSHDGRRLASCADRGTLQISDVVTGQELLTLHTNTGNLRSVAFSPDQTQLAVGTAGGRILIFDARPLTDELRAQLNQAYQSREPLAANTQRGALRHGL